MTEYLTVLEVTVNTGDLMKYTERVFPNESCSSAGRGGKGRERRET